jgi:hypothetical protein
MLGYVTTEALQPARGLCGPALPRTLGTGFGLCPAGKSMTPAALADRRLAGVNWDSREAACSLERFRVLTSDGMPVRGDSVAPRNALMSLS